MKKQAKCKDCNISSDNVALAWHWANRYVDSGYFCEPCATLRILGGEILFKPGTTLKQTKGFVKKA